MGTAGRRRRERPGVRRGRLSDEHRALRARLPGGTATGDRFDTFTAGAKQALARAQTEALRRRHTHISPEHLLLGLLGAEAGAAARVLTALGVDRHRVHRAVAGTLARSQVRVGGPLRLTPRAKQVIALAVEEADRLRHPHLGTEHLLLGVLREREAIAAGALQRLGVTLAQVRAQLPGENPAPPAGSGI